LIMKQVFGAIGHAHSKGVAHNDIKGDNIIVGTAEKATVIDFGESTTEKTVKTIDVAGGIRGPGKLVQTLVETVQKTNNFFSTQRQKMANKISTPRQTIPGNSASCSSLFSSARSRGLMLMQRMQRRSGSRMLPHSAKRRVRRNGLSSQTIFAMSWQTSLWGKIRGSRLTLSGRESPIQI
jgi:serine/threonine protein kinase